MSVDVFAKTDGDNEGSVLDALVGEGRKFGSVEDLAKGKLESDNHISTIEAENATLKEQLAAINKEGGQAASIKELLDTIKATKSESSEGGKPMSSEELAQMVKTVMQDEQTSTTKESNRSQGNELVLKLAEGNVDTARLLVAQRAEALGMTPAALASVSETSPLAFAELMSAAKPNPQSDGSTNVLPGVRQDVLGGNTRALEIDGFKTKAWFDAQKKEMGHVKYVQSPLINNELRKSINGLGERFNN